MKKCIIYVFVLFLLTGCSKEESVTDTSDRLVEIQALAIRNGCDVTIEILDDNIRKKPLTEDEKNEYNILFSQMAKLNGLTFPLEPQQINVDTRATESRSYYKEVSYKGLPCKVSVYWQEDNETGRISNVKAGIGGTKISGATKYTMTYVRDDIIHANESEISIEIKANFSAETFPIVNGKLDISRGPTISIKSKIFVEGKVWPQQMYGEFTIRFVGDGIWEIEREL